MTVLQDRWCETCGRERQHIIAYGNVLVITAPTNGGRQVE
ncbi:hypothetical protein LCGC14_2985340, partial [marine sediment metagenome]